MIIEIEETNYTIEVEENDITVVVEESPVTVEITTGSYQGDATLIQGVPVASGGIEDGQVLIYQDGEYVPGNIESASSSEAVEKEYTAGEILSGHRLVEIYEEKAYYADNSSVNFGRKIGLTKNAAELDASVTVLFFGEITHSSWNFDLTKPVFLGTNGALTQTKPETGYLLVIGKPINTTKLFVNIENIIKLN